MKRGMVWVYLGAAAAAVTVMSVGILAVAGNVGPKPQTIQSQRSLLGLPISTPSLDVTPSSQTTQPPASATPSATASPSTSAFKPQSKKKAAANRPNTAQRSNGGVRPIKGVAGPACGDVGPVKAAWYYNWWITPGCGAPGFVPMISGKDKKTPGDLQWQLSQLVHAGYRTVLGFNEPNKMDQANLTVDQAIALWPNLTADPRVRVGSPATSADARSWFSDFMNQVERKHLRVDFIALHWYGWSKGACDPKAAQLERYIDWAESLPGNRPIWITEMGCMNLSNPDPQTVQKFYTAAAAMIARHPRVERYAWYPWLPNNALTSGGSTLTPLGRSFAAAPTGR